MKDRKITLIFMLAVAAGVIVGLVLGNVLDPTREEFPRTAYSVSTPIPSAPLVPSGEGGGPLDFADIVEAAMPAVVSVTNTQVESPEERRGPQSLFPWFFRNPEPEEFRMPQPDQMQETAGSGFFVSPDGYVLTNNHVAENADRLLLTMQDGRQYEAEVKGTDPSIDLALLKVDTEGVDMPYLPLGDSDSLRVGEWVIAIGYPLELEQTVTVGVVSAKNRRVFLRGTDAGVAVFIQTDAAINFGNSGGPLLDRYGRVVGINTAINRARLAEGIGFALQVSQARRAMEQLREFGEVKRGLIGISMSQGGIDREVQQYYKLPDRLGVLVESVSKGGPADKAGIKAGDIIRSINGNKLRGNDDLLAEISSRKPDEKVDLEVFRGGKTFKTTAKLTERSREALNADRSLGQDREEEDDGPVDTETAAGLGMQVETLDRNKIDPRLRSRLDENLQGVIVTDIEFDSQAADKGVSVGVIIVAINDQPVGNAGDWQRLISQAEPGDTVKLDLSNPDGQPSGFVFLTVPE
jgi:serine protease Do